jgi:hypothetical protein
MLARACGVVAQAVDRPGGVLSPRQLISSTSPGVVDTSFFSRPFGRLPYLHGPMTARQPSTAVILTGYPPSTAVLRTGRLLLARLLERHLS